MGEAASAIATEHEPAPAVGPVLLGERIVSLDVLRGIAVLGILVMNIYAFAMPFPMAYSNPLAMGGTELHNIGTWFFTHIFFDQKFLSIFAMLFGAGVVLMTGRAEARGGKYGRIFYRRQFWLVVIGAVHGYLIWSGDILFMYAVIGMLVYLFRRRSPRTLIIIACLLLPVSLLMNYGIATKAIQIQAEASEITALQDAGEDISPEQEKLLEDWEEFRAFLAPSDEDMQKDLDAYSGSYTEIAAHRAPIVAGMQVYATLFFGILRVAPLMMIGMALMKLGILAGERPRSFYRKLMLAGYLLGLPLTIFSAFNLYVHQFDTQYVMRVGGIANYIGSLVVSFGHIGLILLIFKSGALQRGLARFANVGRMALTNYLMHSVILTSVFYGYGLGLYGTIPRFWQMGFVILIILLQLFVSTWWLNRYRFGPVEWLWRSLTYWKWQSMRHE